MVLLIISSLHYSCVVTFEAEQLTSSSVLMFQNPMWRGLDPSDFTEMESSPGECVIFVVRVWNCRYRERHKLLFQTIMDLNRLGWAGSYVRFSSS